LRHIALHAFEHSLNDPIEVVLRELRELGAAVRARHGGMKVVPDSGRRRDAVVEGVEVVQQVVELGGGEGAGASVLIGRVAGGEHVAERGRGAVVEIRGRAPEPAQGGRVEAP
jgi:hypothetical protein